MLRFRSLILLLTMLAPGHLFSHTVGADFDGDGAVGFSDFVLFARGYGSTQERFDLTEDGTVDFDDFLAFVADYGKVTHEEGASEVGGSLSTFDLIQEHVFNESCLSSSCHNSVGAAGELSLEPGEAYGNLVGIESVNSRARSEGLLRVTPGDVDQSFLIRKLTGSGVGYGDAMPRGFGSLDGIVIDAVTSWILAGAPREGVVEASPDLEAITRLETRFKAPAPPENGIQIHLKPFAIAPGKEREKRPRLPTRSGRLRSSSASWAQSSARRPGSVSAETITSEGGRR